LDAGTEGHGKLTVENGTSEDAKVILYDVSKHQNVREIYVQARKSVEMTGIPEGTYELKYAAGFDWVEDQGFRVDPSFNEFEKTFQYTEQQSAEEIRYHDISITLHPVIGGNVRTRKISREEFLKGHHQTLP